MEWLAIISSLLPLLPGGGGAQTQMAMELAKIVLKLIQQIKEQTGMSTEQILDRAGVTLESNKQKLLADLARLEGANP